MTEPVPRADDEPRVLPFLAVWSVALGAAWAALLALLLEPLVRMRDFVAPVLLVSGSLGLIRVVGSWRRNRWRRKPGLDAAWP